MTTIKDRVLQIAEKEKVSKEFFFKELGFSYANFKGNQKKSALNSNSIDKILSKYDYVNPIWLISGKGSMLKDQLYKANSTTPVIQESSTAYIKPNQGIPLVYQSAAAGFGSSEFAIKEQDVKDYYVIPKFKHQKVDFMIEVRGNSMYPKYNSGDVIACAIINERTFIQWNKPHVIVTKEQGIFVKRILEGKKKSTLGLKSDNKDYPLFEVPTDEITGIALVIGVIRLE